MTVQLKYGTRVHAAGLQGRVTDPHAGVVSGRLSGPAFVRLVEVQWDGQATPVAVREPMLARVTRRKAIAGRK